VAVSQSPRDKGFLQRFVDYGLTQTSLDRRNMQLITALMKYQRLKLIRSVQVVMTMREYEERFRFPAPSLHQTFVGTRRPNRARRRRRFWRALTVVGMMTMTCKVALHHIVQGEIHGPRLHIFSR